LSSTRSHDLALYLIARWVGATAAQEVARLFALQWHQDGRCHCRPGKGQVIDA
jgi:transcriptional regulator GlxA family with amidase domain